MLLASHRLKSGRAESEVFPYLFNNTPSSWVRGFQPHETPPHVALQKLHRLPYHYARRKPENKGLDLPPQEIPRDAPLGRGTTFSLHRTQRKLEPCPSRRGCRASLGPGGWRSQANFRSEVSGVEALLFQQNGSILVRSQGHLQR